MTGAGSGWIIEPEAADDLAATSAAQPFDTLDLDLRIAEQAQQMPPPYVLDGG